MKFFEKLIKTMEEGFDNNLEPLDDGGSFFEVLDDTSDLPTSLIITGINPETFTSFDVKKEFEDHFENFDNDATFQYFKSFHRARVNFTSSAQAATARIQCHECNISGYTVNCYFAQSYIMVKNKDGQPSDGHLQPPSPQRQFLISPPASPPVGWEPVDEATPCVNYDVLTALSKLAPGQAHELHPPSGTQPGIYVHVCEDQGETKPFKIIQTACPERKSSLDEISMQMD